MKIEKPVHKSNKDDEPYYFGSDNDFWFVYDETIPAEAGKLWMDTSAGYVVKVSQG